MSDLRKKLETMPEAAPYLDPSAFAAGDEGRQREVDPVVAPPKVTAEARREHEVEVGLNRNWHRSHFGLGAVLAALVVAGALAIDKLIN